MEIVVIDDVTPDPEIARYVNELAVGGHVTLVRNQKNLGFVQSANRGMALHNDRDVVLLNSDTEVANDWLDRICSAADRDPRIATVTPFSNNATICSYPFDGWKNGVPGTLGLAALDSIFAATNRGRIVDLPTAVGFCMFIRRASLVELGMFDAVRFTRGYGEENDFSLRAMKAGWRNVLAADVFVFHEGGVSFSNERIGLSSAATQVMRDLHPDYFDRVHAFVVADPVSELRRGIDDARVAMNVTEARQVVAEHAEERSVLRRRSHELERTAAETAKSAGDRIEKLNADLAHAAALIGEQDRRISDLDEEIGRLRAALECTESLASTRAHELELIQSRWIWRYVKVLMPRDDKRRRTD